jgi:hypothetical protein
MPTTGIRTLMTIVWVFERPSLLLLDVLKEGLEEEVAVVVDKLDVDLEVGIRLDGEVLELDETDENVDVEEEVIEVYNAPAVLVERVLKAEEEVVRLVIVTIPLLAAAAVIELAPAFPKGPFAASIQGAC